MTIHFWHGLQGHSSDTLHHIVHEWNITSGSKVEVTAFSNYGDPVDEALKKEQKEPPALILAPEFTTSRMKAALKDKRVIPINSLLNPERLNAIADIVKLSFGDQTGTLASLPLNPACGVIYTNKELLQAIGRDPGYVPKSFEELEEICHELIANGLVEKGYTCAWPAAYLIEVPAAQQDKPLVLPDNGRLGYGDYQLSQEWLKDHLLDLREQQKNSIFCYAGRDNNSRQPFINRKVAFYMQGSTHHSLLQKEANGSDKPFQIGCGPLPSLVRGATVSYAFPLGGASIWVLDNEKTQEMIEGVRSFLNHLATPEVQELWHKETAYVPVDKSLPQKLESYYKDHPIHKAVVEQTIEATLGTYSFGIHIPNYKTAREELFSLIEKILDINTSDEKVEELLLNFDKKFSIPQNQ